MVPGTRAGSRRRLPVGRSGGNPRVGGERSARGKGARQRLRRRRAAVGCWTDEARARSPGPNAPGSNSVSVAERGRSGVPQWIRSAGANSCRIWRQAPQGGPASPVPRRPARSRRWRGGLWPARRASRITLLSAHPPLPSPGSSSSGAAWTMPEEDQRAAPRGRALPRRHANPAARRAAASSSAGSSRLVPPAGGTGGGETEARLFTPGTRPRRRRVPRSGPRPASRPTPPVRRPASAGTP